MYYTFICIIHKKLGGSNCGIRNSSFRGKIYTGRHITFMSIVDSVSCLDALVSFTNKL